jgi:hypothetical protein
MQCPSWKLTFHDPTFNFNRNFVVSILGMEMCWFMVALIHPYDDTENA